MKQYHPIDVRYTGPSTSYRGSAHQKAPLRETAKPTPVAAAKPAPSKTNATPWGPTTKPTRPNPPQRAPKPSVSPFKLIGFAFRGVRGVFRTIKYVYFGIIALVFVIAFLSTPSGEMNAVTVPMKTIQTNP